MTSTEMKNLMDRVPEGTEVKFLDSGGSELGVDSIGFEVEFQNGGCPEITSVVLSLE